MCMYNYIYTKYASKCIILRNVYTQAQLYTLISRKLLLFMPSPLVSLSFMCTDGREETKAKKLLICLFMRDLKPSVGAFLLHCHQLRFSSQYWFYHAEFQRNTNFNGKYL